MSGDYPVVPIGKPKGAPAKEVYAEWTREGLKNRILVEKIINDITTNRVVDFTSTDVIMSISRAKCNGDITLRSFALAAAA